MNKTYFRSNTKTVTKCTLPPARECDPYPTAITRFYVLLNTELAFRHLHENYQNLKKMEK